ncbi:MAG: prepilin-type N-terminal cleavage/methylation domain-containing protein [Patescibacteria group bacterium]|nr:prepilin-type N-terminal cleavage/methylation domain-containing protein [Patescibacteria group bacterium]
MNLQTTNYKPQTHKGFTLIEILLVVAAIAILAGIVILAINPSKQLGDTRNAQRRADVNTILNAVYQYTIDNNGIIPAGITTTLKEVCKSAICPIEMFHPSVLISNEKYLVAIPCDPTGSVGDGSGYWIKKTANNRINVVAPSAEQGATISVTR